MRMAEAVWTARRRGIALSVVAAVAGLVAGWWTPHWPVTAPQAPATMALGLAVGWVAGAALRSRWAMLLAPAVFVAVFEVARIGATGPTVDAINAVNSVALLASVAMRVAYGVVAVLPMLVGAACGRAWALRRSPGPRQPITRRARIGSTIRRAGTAMVALGLLVLALAIIRPATTEPILAADGTFLGVLAAQQRPDLYAAFVETGQVVDVAETDQIFYDDTLAWAQRVGDTATVETLRALGEPPYDDPLAMIPVTAGEQDWDDYAGVEGHHASASSTSTSARPSTRCWTS